MHRLKLLNSYLLVLLLTSLLISVDAMAQFGGSRVGGTKRGGTDDRSTTFASRNDKEANVDRFIADLNSSEKLVSRLVELKADLQLNQDQEVIWMKFSDKVQIHIDQLVRQKIKEQPATYSAAEIQSNGMKQLSLMVDSTRNIYTSLEEIEIRAKDLHQVLTPQQKSIMDAKIQFIVVRDIGR